MFIIIFHKHWLSLKATFSLNCEMATPRQAQQQPQAQPQPPPQQLQGEREEVADLTLFHVSSTFKGELNKEITSEEYFKIRDDADEEHTKDFFWFFDVLDKAVDRGNSFTKQRCLKHEGKLYFVVFKVTVDNDNAQLDQQGVYKQLRWRHFKSVERRLYEWQTKKYDVF
eukprot:m.9122 g.9122  ORF g.9122 m.9122 type:complete len:169 (-) comp5426_c0_seq1:134-640(-)